MIDYIGDISNNDAEVLKDLAKRANDILEFGCGASTQVLAYYTSGTVVSVETEPSWIQKTGENLIRLNIQSKVYFKSYEQFKTYPEGPYDLIFDDGVDGYRAEFAESSWKLLKVGGALCFHDTRRSQDIANVCTFIAAHSPEIESIIINKDHSNITVIRKKVAEFYENWNLVEGKGMDQYGKA